MEEKSIGERIAERRRRAGWGQRELAARSSLSPTTINRIEKGLIQPNWSTLGKIAQSGFEISTEELVSPKVSSPKSPREVLEELRRSGVLRIEVSTDDNPDPRGLDVVDEAFAADIVKAVNEANLKPGDAYGVYVVRETETAKASARVTPLQPVHGLLESGL